MPTHTPNAPDLRSALTLANDDHAFWSTHEGRIVLSHALTSLRPLALRVNADPADALSYAWEAWVSMSPAVLADAAVDLWAYTRAAVRRSLDRDDEANRRGLSVGELRRAGAREVEITTGIDGIDIAYRHVDAETTPEPASDPRGPQAMEALEQVLTLAGFTTNQRIVLIDVFADLVGNSPSRRASIERALAVHELVAPHLEEPQWRSLVEVILGTAAGRPGVMALAGAGHPAPAMEPHISANLLSIIAVAA